MIEFLRSNWIKFIISLVVVWWLVSDIMSGEITPFWFLLLTFFLAYLLTSRKDDEETEEEDDDDGPLGLA